MSEKPQPPADDDEARFDDEGSAVGHAEPDETERPKQKTKTGASPPSPPPHRRHRRGGERSPLASGGWEFAIALLIVVVLAILAAVGTYSIYVSLLAAFGVLTAVFAFGAFLRSGR